MIVDNTETLAHREHLIIISHVNEMMRLGSGMIETVGRQPLSHLVLVEFAITVLIPKMRHSEKAGDLSIYSRIKMRQ